MTAKKKKKPETKPIEVFTVFGKTQANVALVTADYDEACGACDGLNWDGPPNEYYIERHTIEVPTE